MGGKTSKSQEYEDAIQYFTLSELQAARDLFRKISGSEKSSYSETDFQKFTEKTLTKDLSNNLFNACSNIIFGREETVNIDEEAFVIFLYYATKGSASDKAKLFSLACSKSITKHSLEKITTELLLSYEKCMELRGDYTSWTFNSNSDYRTFSRYLLSSLQGNNPELHLILSEVEDCLRHSPILLKICDYVFKTVLNSESEGLSDMDLTPSERFQLPCANDVNWSKFRTQLTLSSLTLLMQHLPMNMTKRWTLLFNSEVHGQSFSTFVKNVVDKGPCILIVKDTRGHIFGGYTSTNLSIGPSFFGDDSSFLFTLSPDFAIYTSSGFNSHFVYFNQHQETMPNGFGMGGQLKYFGLWLDSDFGKGHSKAKPSSTTFKSPQLSAEDEFEIDILEVWSVSKPKVYNNGNESDEEIKQSILDKDPEAKAMLSLLDKGPVSEGLREHDMTADIPEEHSIPSVM
ncbi:DgyrCDS6208 [Dimorphilus gyrociliatus]|uniref:MTOR-associated protein MEAK7 n=1 Tax=Dimorphilus gyrociliatus TaxID=2664684 RepID=A0A7I8VPQ3_9ANNE|nr:DgyrCDS6208 [Dimorphilus gyrociliatus]